MTVKVIRKNPYDKSKYTNIYHNITSIKEVEKVTDQQDYLGELPHERFYYDYELYEDDKLSAIIYGASSKYTTIKITPRDSWD